MTRIT